MANLQTVISDVNFGLGLLSSFGPKVDVVGIYSNGSGNQGGAGIGNLSSSIINSLTGNIGAVASFGQLFENARPMKATVRETSRVMEHPLETGVTLADHHIINPVEIEIPMIVKSEFYVATYSQIRQAFINATLLAVKTRVGVYSNMIIAELPHEEEPEMYDAITIGLRLRQAIYVVPSTGQLAENFQPIDPLNTNTIASGLQQASALGAQLAASAASVSSYAAIFRRGLL